MKDFSKKIEIFQYGKGGNGRLSPKIPVQRYSKYSSFFKIISFHLQGKGKGKGKGKKKGKSKLSKAEKERLKKEEAEKKAQEKGLIKNYMLFQINKSFYFPLIEIVRWTKKTHLDSF